MSSDGQYQSATVVGGNIYVSSDYGNTWTPKATNQAWTGIAMSADGQRQTAVATGNGIYVSTDYGNTWGYTTGYGLVLHDVDVSSDGQIQAAIAVNDYVYVSNNFGASWTPQDSARIWYSIAVSTTGVRKTAVGGEIQIYTAP
jgi:photosystem II stability/assembly factor-like uncharacterized protein